MEGSSKKGSGSKKNPVRHKVRANLGEPARFRLQDEPDQVPHFQTQQFPPFQTQQYPPFQSQAYQNQPFVPPFQPHQFQPQSFPHFQTQSHQVDPLEDNTLIHHFACAYREPQQNLDDDDEDEDDVQEEEEENEEEEDEDVQQVVPPSVRGHWRTKEEIALVKAYLHTSENNKIFQRAKKKGNVLETSHASF
ncbi:alpha/beta-gliadin clone PW1215-like [Helianthus annuus]|uniref:alpha/beta-gliadin clone PW1215-like n=1 Tax=Helianthus annuus TaxID=4232 RepID=UPI001652C55C|nr:alpha/beta-gliadin clone PW1215-like [Helianthus annuus]